MKRKEHCRNLGGKQYLRRYRICIQRKAKEENKRRNKKRKEQKASGKWNQKARCAWGNNESKEMPGKIIKLHTVHPKLLGYGSQSPKSIQHSRHHSLFLENSQGQIPKSQPTKRHGFCSRVWLVFMKPRGFCIKLFANKTRNQRTLSSTQQVQN